jgi:hypothetical protein
VLNSKHSRVDYRRNGGIAPRILDAGTRWRAWLASSHGLFFPGGRAIILWIENRVGATNSLDALSVLGMECGFPRRWVCNLVAVLTQLTWLSIRWALIEVQW